MTHHRSYYYPPSHNYWSEQWVPPNTAIFQIHACGRKSNPPEKKSKVRVIVQSYASRQVWQKTEQFWFGYMHHVLKFGCLKTPFRTYACDQIPKHADNIGMRKPSQWTGWIEKNIIFLDVIVRWGSIWTCINESQSIISWSGATML